MKGKLNTEIINKIRQTYCPNEDMFTDEQIFENLNIDYSDFVDIRNKIKDNVGFDEEEVLCADHILDYLEIFIDEVRGEYNEHL